MDLKLGSLFAYRWAGIFGRDGLAHCFFCLLLAWSSIWSLHIRAEESYSINTHTYTNPAMMAFAPQYILPVWSGIIFCFECRCFNVLWADLILVSPW